MAGSYGGNAGTITVGGNGGTNTGGGGGGSITYGSYAGGNGGSGLVIISYASATQRGTGGTVTSSGGYFIHTFTSSGTFVA